MEKSMTLKAPLHPEHMIPNSMEVYIWARWGWDLMQLGFYKDQDMQGAGESVEDVYSNGTLKKTKDGNKITLSITAHELTTEKIAILQSGLVELMPWTVTSEVEKFAPWDWSYDRDILLKFSNGDETAVTPTSVTALIDGTETALTENTDYTVKVNMFGATSITMLTGETGGKLDENSPYNTRITVTYSTTSDSTQVMDHKANAIAKPFVMVLINEFDYNGEKKFIKTFLDNCQASKATLKQIADSDNTTVGLPLEITGFVVKQDFKGFSQSTSNSSNTPDPEEPTEPSNP